MPQIFVNLLSLQSLKNFKYEILEKLVPKAILQVESVNIIKIWILILVHCTCTVLYKTVEGLVTTQLLLCHGGKNCQNWVKILNSIFTYLIFLPWCQIVWHLHDIRRKDFCFVIMLILFFSPSANIPILLCQSLGLPPFNILRTCQNNLLHVFANIGHCL